MARPEAGRLVRRAHTAELSREELAAARGLCDRAFAHLPENERFGDDDWEHALGGQHVLVYDLTELVGHGALVQRRLLHQGRALRTGYVEAVAVSPSHQRRGIGSVVMDELERLAPAYDVLALGASDDGVKLYERRGWQQWRGRLSVMTPNGTQRTEEDEGGVYVLPGAADLDIDGELACDWRDGDVW